MIRRVCSRLLRIALGLMIALLLLTAVFIWRLAKQPIPLNLLTPYIETALPPSLTGFQVDVQDVALAWNHQAKRIVLSARNMHLRDTHGIVDATLPTVDATLNLKTLLRQRAVALNRVYMDGAQLHLKASPPGEPEPNTQPAWPLPTPSSLFQALEIFIAALESRTLFADLNAVHIADSAVTFYRASLSHPIHIPAFDFMVRRTGNNISSKLSLITSISETDIEFDLDTFYEPSARQLSLKSKFANLRPSDLAALDPAFSALSGTTVAFTGSLNLALSPQDTWPAANFIMQGSPGQVTLPGLYREPQQIEALTASGHLNGANDILQTDMTITAPGTSPKHNPRLHLKSTVTGLSRPSRVEGDVTLTSFTMADLESYWPPGVAQAARQWITQNMPEGLLHQTQAHVVFGASQAKPPALRLQDLTGSFAYEGLSVHYLRPLPPIENLAGTGQFNRSGFQFQVASGNLEDLILTESQVDITDLNRPAQAIAIQAGLTGPLQKALTLLNHPHLDLIAGIGIPLENATGQFQAESKFAFALSKSVQLQDIDLSFQGTLQDVSLKQISLDQDLSNGQLRIDLDKHRMTIAGQAEWATIPLSLTWDSVFHPQNHSEPWRNQVHLEIPRVGHAGRARLGYDLPGIIEGPMAAVIHAQYGWDNQQTIDLQLDLRETVLSLPWLNWQKPADEPGKATGTLHLSANRATALTDLLLETNTLKARGNAQFDGASLAQVELPYVTLGTSDLRDVIFQPLNPGLAITIGDGFLDATPFQQFLTNPSTAPDQHDTPSTVAFPVQLNLPRLHRVQTAPGRYLRHVQAHLAWDEAGLKTITASGRVPIELTRKLNGKPSDASTPPKSFDFHYLRNPKQPPNLSLQTNDMGAVLRALNFYDNFMGGEVNLTGRTTEDRSGIKTKLQAAQFTVKQAPVIAHVLAAASLHGLANLLGHDGLKFDNLDAELTLYGDRLTIKRSNAQGGSLGVTARGDITYQSGGLDVQGTVIPAYLLNSILGQVPVVNLLVGGKGQGLVAVNYHLTGKFAEPKVSVNPISAFTPGFLRGIFRLFKKDKQEKAPPSAPGPETEQETQINEP